MKKLLSFLIVFVGLSSYAGDISRNITFTDGQVLSAAQLHQLIDGASINTTFFTTKPTEPTFVSSDYVLVYSPTLGGFYKVTGSQFLYNNAGFFTNAAPFSSLISGGSTNSVFLIYDPVNGVQQITVLSLATNLSSYLNPALFNFYTLSNGIPFSPLLTAYSPAQPSPIYMTNQVQFLVFDTNGIPKTITQSNLLSSFAPTLGTNLDLPYVYNQIFLPQTVYSTNSFGFTNAWGIQTGFAITNYFQTNTILSVSASNTPTLTDTDAVPIMSFPQKTNTTFTLLSLYQYLTNKTVINTNIYSGLGFSLTNTALVTNNTGASLFGYVQFTNSSGAGGILISNATLNLIVYRSMANPQFATNTATFFAAPNQVFQAYYTGNAGYLTNYFQAVRP